MITAPISLPRSAAQNSQDDALTRKLTRKENDALTLRRMGVVDIGSNSVRLVIYELLGAAATPIYSEKVLAGLGRGLKVDGKLYAPGAAQAFKALARFRQICSAHNLDKTFVVATAAMREASDGPDFIARVAREIGFEIECLSGEQEAQMAAYGVIAGDARARGIVADLGGASLELIKISDRRPGYGTTFPLGPFVIEHNKSDDYDLAYLRAHIAAALSGIERDFSAHNDTLYLVGGAWRNLAMIHNQRTGYPLPILHGYAMSAESGLALASWAGETAAADLMNWPKLSSRRAETLPYSGLMLEALIQKLNPARLVISPSGVREGRLYASLCDKIRQRDTLMDACRHLALGNEQGRDFGQPLFDWLSPAMQAFPSAFDLSSETRLRRAACLLVGIGKGLHPDHRAALVFSDVLFAPLSGLTHKERAYLALMLFASYSGTIETPHAAAIDYHLLEREKNCARIFGTAMRLGSVISALSPQTLSNFTLTADKKSLRLFVDEAASTLLNRRGQMRAKSLASLLDVKLETNWTKSET